MHVTGFGQAVGLFLLLCLLWLCAVAIASSSPEGTGQTAPGENAGAPQKARDLLKAILKRDGAPLPGYIGGQEFHNRERRLPRGRYREYDVNPRSRTGHRDAERLVIEQRTGKAYYTPDHYGTFLSLN
jgi:ribonuclease T1